MLEILKEKLKFLQTHGNSEEDPIKTISDWKMEENESNEEEEISENQQNIKNYQSEKSEKEINENQYISYEKIKNYVLEIQDKSIEEIIKKQENIEKV